MATPPPPYVGTSVVQTIKLPLMSVLDSPEEPRITPEGLARIRERARLRTMGAPVKVWSQSSDREDPPDAKPHTPIPPTPQQADAANELFEKMLSGTPPNGFGEGLESLANGRWSEPPPTVGPEETRG